MLRRENMISGQKSECLFIGKMCIGLRIKTAEADMLAPVGHGGTVIDLSVFPDCPVCPGKRLLCGIMIRHMKLPSVWYCVFKMAVPLTF